MSVLPPLQSTQPQDTPPHLTAHAQQHTLTSTSTTPTTHSTTGHASLRSRGAPAPVAFLNGLWERCDAEPIVAHRPHYTKPHPTEESSLLHLFYSKDTASWQVASEIDAGLVFVAAQTLAHHPNTVPRRIWRLAKITGDEVSLEDCPDFEVSTDGPNTEEQPFSMDELGRDFFLRMQVRTRKVIWFMAPSGEVYHSAAKPGAAGTVGGRSQPGKRYCHLCDKCFSANNFQTQHLANCHRPTAPSGVACVVEPTGGVKIVWVPPDTPGARGEPEISAYQLRFSVDGGLTWQVGIPATDSSMPSARVGNLASGAPYIFSVAAINLAGVGPPSEPSAPVVASGPRTVVSESDTTASTASYPGTPASPGSSSGIDIQSDSNSDAGTHRTAKRPREGNEQQEWSLLSKPVPAPPARKKKEKKVDVKIQLNEADGFLLDAVVDDDLAKTLSNLLEDTYEAAPALDSLKVPAVPTLKSMVNFSFGSITSVTRQESLQLEGLDLDSLLADSDAVEGDAPTYRRAAPLNAAALRDGSAGAWGKLRAVVKLMGAKPKPTAEENYKKLRVLLPRASPKLKAQLLSSKLLARLHRLGHSRAATLLLTHGAAAAGGAKATSLDIFEEEDEHSTKIRREADLLRLAAIPEEAPAAPTEPTLVRLPPPRAHRSRNFLSWFALLVLAVAAWTPPVRVALGGGYVAAAAAIAPSPPLECGWKSFLSCGAISDPCGWKGLSCREPGRGAACRVTWPFGCNAVEID